MIIKKYGISLLIIIIMLVTFMLVATMQYNHSVSVKKDSLREEILQVQTNIETMISSRIINVNGLARFIEFNHGINREAFEVFAEEIYASEQHVVKDVVFISDTTISYIYPRHISREAIGVDLANIDEQKDLLLYSKENNKTIFLGPVDLVEGGKGIIIRVPVFVKEEYYGQVALVFDFDSFLEVSGLLDMSEDNYVTLKGRSPLTDNISTIWMSGNAKETEPISEKIVLNDIQWDISASPNKGWLGFSGVFFLIIILGFVATIGSIIVYKKEWKLKRELEKTNDNLHKSFEELALSQIELADKYKEVKARESDIQELANQDVLTGLFNRRLFSVHLEEAIESQREGVIILIDIDDFKNINDIHGHVFGDNLLKEFAKALKKIVKNVGRAYRLGGDEFLVVFNKNYTDYDIMEYSKMVRARLNRSITKKVNCPITMSVGAVRFPEQGSDVESLLIKVDVAMYKSKDSGKNQMTIFEKAMLDKLDRKMAIESKVRSLINDNGFEMNYQPIVDSKTGEIVSFEALIRMKDREFNPMEFIKVAEESGQIIKLGHWIFDNVFKQMSKWIDEGLDLPPVAINLSPLQLLETGFKSILFEKIKEENIPSHLIELEITENVLLENVDVNIKVLEEIREIGVKVSMDDFGTGYSSLKYLTYLPIDKVKIDKNLKDQLIEMGSLDVVDGITTMVHGLGMKVVAEGIEEACEWEVLSKVGCDQLQGFVFSQAVPAHEVCNLLKMDFNKLRT